MVGKKGEITRAQKGKKKSVYFSNVFAVWLQEAELHVTRIGSSKFHAKLNERDGLLYEVVLMLYRHGLSLPQAQPAGPRLAT